MKLALLAGAALMLATTALAAPAGVLEITKIYRTSMYKNYAHPVTTSVPLQPDTPVALQGAVGDDEHQAKGVSVVNPETLGLEVVSAGGTQAVLRADAKTKAVWYRFDAQGQGTKPVPLDTLTLSASDLVEVATAFSAVGGAAPYWVVFQLRLRAPAAKPGGG